MYTIRTHIARIDAREYLLRFRDEDKFMDCCRECPKFGRSWACPPYGYDTLEYLSGYAYVYIICSKVIPSPETAAICTDSLTGRETGEAMLDAVRRELDSVLLDMEKGEPRSKAFFAGSCKLCREEDCTRLSGRECRFPDKIRPSLEAMGFDVVATARELFGIEMRWSKDGLLPEYYTLTSGFFAVGQIADIEKYFKSGDTRPDEK